GAETEATVVGSRHLGGRRGGGPARAGDVRRKSDCAPVNGQRRASADPAHRVRRPIPGTAARRRVLSIPAVAATGARGTTERRFHGAGLRRRLTLGTGSVAVYRLYLV